MARVLLVRPPVASEELFAPGTVDASTLSPPLGLAYLAAYLRDRGHECAIVDGFVERVSVEQIAAKAAAFDLVGITVLSVFAMRAIELMAAIKQRCPGVPIVAGGAHATAVPETLLERGADYVVSGEGEVTLYELVESLFGDRRLGDRRLGDRRPIERVAGVVYLRDGRCVRTGVREPIEPLDQVPLPARDLLPMDQYRDSVVRSRGLPTHVMMSSRGCPGTCTFCHKQTFGTKVRYFSPDRIVEEFCLLHEQYHAQHVSIYDDNFVTNHEIVFAVCDALRRRNVTGTWSLEARIDAVDEKVLRAMKAAGCTQIEYGIESGSQRVLDFINKRIAKDEIRKTVQLTKQIGVTTRGYFILGFPTETRAEMEETIRFALELDMDLVSFTLFTPLPGTVDYRRALESGRFRDPEFYLHEILGDFAFPENPLYVPAGFTERDLLAVHRSAYRRYYLRPRMLLRRLRALRSGTELIAMAKGALSLVLPGFKRK